MGQQRLKPRLMRGTGFLSLAGGCFRPKAGPRHLIVEALSILFPERLLSTRCRT